MIYFIQEKGLFRNRVKIGYTDNIRQRLGQIQSQSPSRLKLVLALPGDETDEFVYHKKFAAYRLHGEWFKCGVRLKIFTWLNQFTVFASPVSGDKSLPESANETEAAPDSGSDEQKIIDAFRESVAEDGKTVMSHVTQRLGWTPTGPNFDRIRNILEKWEILVNGNYTADEKSRIMELFNGGDNLTKICTQLHGYKNQKRIESIKAVLRENNLIG